MTEETRTSQTQWRDWIGELFTPTLDVEVGELLGNVEDEGPIQSKIKHVAAFDPEAIRQVYERVRVMMALDEEMKKSDKQRKQKESESVGDTKKTVKEKEINLNDSCIWDSNEIGVLRQVFKTVKEENTKLNVRCRELEKHNLYLESKLSSVTGHFDNEKKELTEAQKANKRLKIHCDVLQNELDHANAKATAMEEVFKELQEEKTKLAKEVHALRVGADKERLDKSRLQMKLDTIHQEVTSERMVAEESIKIKFQSIVMKLKLKNKELSDELENEKKLHSTTRKALEHLRQHFASLPLNHIIPPNSVQNDQVSQFEYS